MDDGNEGYLTAGNLFHLDLTDLAGFADASQFLARLHFAVSIAVQPGESAVVATASGGITFKLVAVAFVLQDHRTIGGFYRTGAGPTPWRD